MPKVLVLVVGDSDSSKSIAQSVREGAASVRFTEVDIRAVESYDAADLRDYDGIVVVGSGRNVSPAFATLIASGDLTDANAFPSVRSPDENNVANAGETSRPEPTTTMPS